MNQPNLPPYIIGVTGTFNSGKGTLSSYIVEKYGFNHLSVRQFIIDHTEQQEFDEISDERDRLRVTADRVRGEHGPNYMIKELYEQALKSGKSTIIESVRCPSEAEYILRHKGMLLGIDADMQIRFDRMKNTTDLASVYSSIEEMRIKEEKEMHNTDPTRGNISKCLEMSNYVFFNNREKKFLYAEIRLVLPMLIYLEGIKPGKERRG